MNEKRVIEKKVVENKVIEKNMTKSKMIVREENGNIYVRLTDFSLEQTLECGQCFHFEKLSYNEYVLSAKGRFLHVAQDENLEVIFYNTNRATFDEVWIDYFDLNRDYNAIKEELRLRDPDGKLKEAMGIMWGIRILNQDFFETMISFIISQNKQIPHIKKIVATLSSEYGKLSLGAPDSNDYEGHTINSGVRYSFPNAKELIGATIDGIRACKTGFRAPYIMDACVKYEEALLDEKALYNMDYDEVMRTLMQVHGIGQKVANCIALFGLSKRNAFPVDVWIKRTMESIYIGHEADKEQIEKLAKELFGEYGGYAQQYLFYYGKEQKIGK